MGGKVASQIGLGELSGHTYKHGYFKLEVTIPEEWYIQSRSETEQLMQVGSSLTKQDANTQAIVQSSQQRTLTLLSAFQNPPGTPGALNPSFMILAENVSFLPGLKQGEDYLQLLQKSLSVVTLKYEVDPIETGFKIGSNAAARLTTHLRVGDQQIEQEYYAARIGDYFLLVLLTFGNEEQAETLRALLRSMKAG